MRAILKLILIGGLILAANAPGPASAAEMAADIAALAAAYGARPTVTGMKMSPSGDKILYYTPAGTQGHAVVVADTVAGTTKIILSSPTTTAVPHDCGWKGETRVICHIRYIGEIGASRTSFRRAISIAADGSSRVSLGQRDSDKQVGVSLGGAVVIDWLPDDPDHVLMGVNMAAVSGIGSNVGGNDGGYSVQRVDVGTGKMATVERAKRQVQDYGSDNQGRVRYMATGEVANAGYVRDQIVFLLRDKTSKEWRRVAQNTLSGFRGWRFEGFDESGDSIFVLRDKDGHQALFRDPVESGAGGGLVFAHPDVDVDGLLRIGKFQRPVAAVYTTEATHYAFFDQTLARRAKALSAVLPGRPAVEILDESWDGSRNLVFAAGIDDSGQYFRFDVATRKLSPLLAVRPELAGRVAGAQAAVRYPAGDGAMVPGFLTVPAAATGRRPAIIMPHGGPSARDAAGFDWLAQYFTQLGYVVLQPNFRGSSGYGTEWYAKNGFKSWATAMADINAGARWLVSQGIADPGRIAIFGWSYGGYAALQASIVDPGLYKAIVAIAPVTDLALLKREAREFGADEVMNNYIGAGPHVVAGSPAQNAGRIAAPVLMFHGDKDLNVDIEQARAMDAALAKAGKQHRLVVYPGLAHSLDDSVARADLLKQSAVFLAGAMK